jgi:sugar (pentulose or hexulose) kinase
MKDGRCILVLDVGTSSLKARILDINLNTVKSARHDYDYDTTPDMGAEIRADRIWNACLVAMRRFGSSLRQVEAVVPSVFCPGLVAMDKAGGALYPAIIHMDRRSTREAMEARDTVGREKFLKIAGNLPYPGGISLTSMLWLRRHEPDVFKKTWKFGHINTYLVKKLTGKWGIDPTNASFTGLYQTVSGDSWSREIAGRLAIPVRKLPPVIKPDRPVGSITKEASRLTGLRAGVPVLMGANDTSCAALGAGVVESGQMLNIAGSSEIFVVAMDRPVPDKEYYLRQHAVPNRWLLLVTTTSGFSLEWFRNQFCREMTRDEFYQVYLPRVLRQKNDGSVCFRAHLAGDRNSFTQKKASFSGLTLASKREECLLAIVKGSMAPMKKAIQKSRRFIELSDTIAVTGGSANPVMIQQKKQMFPGFKFQTIGDCSVLGAGKLAQQYLCGS